MQKGNPTAARLTREVPPYSETESFARLMEELHLSISLSECQGRATRLLGPETEVSAGMGV